MTSGPGEIPHEKTWRVGSLTYTWPALTGLFFWLLCGDFALAMRDRAIPQVIQAVFKEFGASDFITGVIFSSIPAMLSLFIGPVVSYKSDRLRSRWGRRIPFLIVPVPFIVLATVGLAFSPQFGSHLHHLLGNRSPGMNGSIILLLGFFWTLFEVCCFVGSAVFNALLNDVVPQVTMGRFQGLFRAVSLVAGMIFFFNLMAHVEANARAIFLGIGALYGVLFTAMCVMVKEGRYPSLPKNERGHGLVFAVWTYLRSGLGNTYYLWYFAATVLGGLCAGPFNLFSFYYSRDIGMSSNAFGKCIALTFACSFLLSVPLGMAADRFHPLRLSIVTLALYAATMFAAGLWVHGVASFAVALVVHGVASGCMFSAWASLPQRLLPRDKFAEIGSVGGIIGAVISIFFGPALGQFLDYMHHDYRYTFFASAALTLLALWAFVILHRRFMALGGPLHYQAPE